MENNKWKDKALQKQLAYKQSLGLTKSGKHGDKFYKHILSDEDAEKGFEFFCYNNKEVWNDLKNWANKDRGINVNFLSNGLKNMLRSEHIAYSVFYPLHLLKNKNPEKLSSLIQKIVNIPVDSINDIKIEYAGDKDKTAYLEDNTSFDAYIEFTSQEKKCALGVEIKYTELSYPYGDTEKKRLFDDNSEYMKVAQVSGYYKNSKSENLKAKKLKQPFRNHLLGIKMEHINEINDFYSVHFYPSGNKYQSDVAEAYKNEISDDYKNKFIDLTFEEFIQKAKDSEINEPWLDYFESRY